MRMRRRRLLGRWPRWQQVMRLLVWMLALWLLAAPCPLQVLSQRAQEERARGEAASGARAREQCPSRRPWL